MTETTYELDLVDVTVPGRSQPSVPILRGVNWQVARGEFWAVAGLHESGKSDLLSLATGLTRPLAGTCRVCGGELAKNSSELAPPERLRVGLLFDGEGRLFHQLTVRDNIALPLLYHRPQDVSEAAQRTQLLLEHLELAEVADTYPSAISRNWRLRVALARALALEPRLLLLDSPLVQLDPRHIRWWIQFLKQLHQGHAALGGRPITIIVATADIRPWERVATHFALLEQGRFFPLGTDSAGAVMQERLSELRGSGWENI